MTIDPSDLESSSTDQSSQVDVSQMSFSEADDLVAIGNAVISSNSASTKTGETGAESSSSPNSDSRPVSTLSHTSSSNSFKDVEEDADTATFHDALDSLPVAKKLNQRLSMYSPQVRETEEWEQIMQDWNRVMAEKKIQDAKVNLMELENKRFKSRLEESEQGQQEIKKQLEELTKENKELKAKTQADPSLAKDLRKLKSQLQEAEAENELLKLVLEETEGEKKRVELKLVQVEKEKDLFVQKTERVKNLKKRLKVKAAEFELLSSTSTSSLLEQSLEGTRPDSEKRKLMTKVQALETDRSRLAALVSSTMSTSGSDAGSIAGDVDSAIAGLGEDQLRSEIRRQDQELQMSKVENSLLQRRIEVLEVTLHDVRVALTNSDAHVESLETKKYDLQDKLVTAESNLDRARIELTKYQGLHKEALQKNGKSEREVELLKARFEAKDRVLISTQKQLSAARVDGGLLKTIRRELESVLFDYNTVVQHFMDIQVQAIGAKALANTLKRQCNDLQAQLTHYRTMLLGIKSFNNNDPIKSPTVATLRSEFRDLLEKIQTEQNSQIERERSDKFKAQDWNRKLRMEKDFMKLELQNQVEKWRRVSVYWEDKWRKTANDLHEAVTTPISPDLLYDVATAHSLNNANTSAPNSARSSVSYGTPNGNGSTNSKRISVVIPGANGLPTDPMTPSAMKQHILETKSRQGSVNGLTSGQVRSHPNRNSLLFSSSSNLTSPTTSSPQHGLHSPTGSASTGSTFTDLVSSVKPFLSRSTSSSSSVNGTTSSSSGSTTAASVASSAASTISQAASSLIGAVGTGRGPPTPSSRLAAAASLRTPIAAGLPSNITGTGAMGNTSVSAASIRSRSMAASAIGTARTQALQAGIPGAVVTVASKEAQSRANASISSMAKNVDHALSESDRLKADVRRMLNRS